MSPQRASPIEREGTSAGRCCPGARERGLQPGNSFPRVSPELPEAAQRARQAKLRLRTGRVGPAPVERGPQVVVLPRETIEPGRLIGPLQRQDAPLRQRQEPIAVTSPQGLGFSRLLQPLLCV